MLTILLYLFQSLYLPDEVKFEALDGWAHNKKAEADKGTTTNNKKYTIYCRF